MNEVQLIRQLINDVKALDLENVQDSHLHLKALQAEQALNNIVSSIKDVSNYVDGLNTKVEVK